MARTVQLSEDAYASLAALKVGNESFSDVVRRLVASRKDPRRLLDLAPVREDFDLARLREGLARADAEKLRRLAREG